MNINSLSLSTLPEGSTVWAYVRDNGVQDKDKGVTQQRNTIEAYCKLQGLKLEKVFEDVAKSGASLTGRNGIQELLALVGDPNQHPVGVLIVDVNRLGRNIHDVSRIVSKIRKQGIVIHSLSELFLEDLSFMVNNSGEASQ